MAVTVKEIKLWRSEVTDRAGALADALGPLAAAKADLKVVMGYRIPGEDARAMLELAPVSGKSRTAAAQLTGLAASVSPTLLVEGDNRPGLGHAMTRAIADAGISLSFMVALVSGRRFSAVIGFDSATDASRASAIVRKATGKRKK